MENEEKDTEDLQSDSEELNEDGVPRPPKDPLNWLYTLISLAIFAVGYFGINYAKSNFFLPYSRTATEISDEAESVLLAETYTPLPEGAVISSARISSGTDSDLLHIWYRDIGDKEDFADSLGFEYGDILTEQRCSVFRSDSFDETFVFADIYVSSEEPGLSCLVYDYDGSTYAEFRKSGYSPEVKSVFADSPKVRLPAERTENIPQDR